MATNANKPFSENGISYASVSAQFNGLTLEGMTSYTFTVTQEKTNNYAAGANPISRSVGTKVYEGSLDLTVDTQLAIANAFSPSGSLVDVPAGIFTLTFLRADGGRLVKTYNNFEFTADESTGSEGDTNLVGSIPIIFGGVTSQLY